MASRQGLSYGFFSANRLSSKGPPSRYGKSKSNSNEREWRPHDWLVAHAKTRPQARWGPSDEGERQSEGNHHQNRHCPQRSKHGAMGAPAKEQNQSDTG